MKKKTSIHFKVWMIVSFVLLSTLITASICAVQIPFLYNTLCSVLGGEHLGLISGNPDDYIRYQSDYESKSEVLEAANDLNEEICEEGFVLLKNEGNVLPLQSGSKISVFGQNSVNIVLGGSGSNSGGSTGTNIKTVYSSLEDAGFSYNTVLKSFYENSPVRRPQAPGMGSILTGFPVSEAPITSYTAQVRDSYSQYNDLALVVISRIGGEGFDLPRSMRYNGNVSNTYTTWPGNQIIPGARSEDDHYLQLDQDETDMLNEACSNFANVVVVINSANTIELGFLDDPTHYAYHPNIKGAIWVGTPGNTGMGALGKILSGAVNPSGRTPDIYARDFRNDPTWNNFGNNLRNDGNRYFCERVRNAWCVEYEEGIYTGYRYYETRDFVKRQNGVLDWYEKNVVYPFGYGLSYTSFEWEVTPVTPVNSIINGASELSFEVTVTNNGDVAGKEVVQLYYTAPYVAGEIEKSHVVLKDFIKTELIAPYQSATYTLSIKGRDMASYDYNDGNHNGFKGYELEEGNYAIKIMKNSHEVVDEFNYIVENNQQFKYDTNTHHEIKNLFDDVSGHIHTYLSRNDFDATWPTMMNDEDLVVSTDFISSLTYKVNDTEDEPWYSDEMPDQASSEVNRDKIVYKFYELHGLNYNNSKFEYILDNLTVDQMWNLVKSAEYRTTKIENIDKPLTIDADGPMGFAVFMGDPSIYDTCYYAGEVVAAATWNIELIEKMGEMVGNEALIGNERGDGRPYSGWYAPAMNLHRSQFGGRNFEYYSEDGFLSGRMATAIVKGTQKKGVYTYCKHFALNEQETNRDSSGLITWANEQAMRENYFTPFEMVVKEGKTTAMMSSFNRLGTVWAGGNYNLLTRLLREEWGFIGMVITDFNLTDYMNIDQMIRAGGDLSLSPDKKMKDKTSATAVTNLRRAVKNVLYTIANSNATNGFGEGVIYGYIMPGWVNGLVWANVGVGALLLLWGALLIIFKKHVKQVPIKKKKEGKK